MNSKSSVMMILPSEELFGLKVSPVLSRVKLYFILYETRITFHFEKHCLNLCWKEFIGTSLSPIGWMEKLHR